MSPTGLCVSTVGLGLILGVLAASLFGPAGAWAAIMAGALLVLAGTFTGGRT